MLDQHGKMKTRCLKAANSKVASNQPVEFFAVGLEGKQFESQGRIKHLNRNNTCS